MKLLLDTNILLDCMMDRHPFAADARKILILGALGEVDLWMSPAQFTDAFYLLTEGGKPRLAEGVKLRLLKVKRLARICTFGEQDVEEALESLWLDFEDACLYQCARKLNVDAIVTRNQADFEYSTIPVYDCGELLSYLKKYCNLTYEEIELPLLSHRQQ